MAGPPASAAKTRESTATERADRPKAADLVAPRSPDRAGLPPACSPSPPESACWWPARVAWASPSLAPLIAPLVVLVGAVALWGANRADHRRLSADLDRLAGDNRRLAETVEHLSDAAWEIRESEERYRSLIEARQRAEAASQAEVAGARHRQP